MNQQTIVVEMEMLTDDIATNLAPLMEREEFQRMARKTARRLSFIFLLAIPTWAVIKGLFTHDVDSAMSGMIVLPFVIPFALITYHAYSKSSPQKIAGSGFYTRLVGTTKITVDPQGVTLDKRYSNPKTTPWKKIKRIYRLKKCWYFVLSATSLKTLFIPLSALEMPEQDVLIRELCQTYWQGAIIES